MIKILMLGDVIQDFNLMEYPPVPSHNYQALPKTSQGVAQGGVLYLRDLIKKVVPEKSAEIQCPADARWDKAIKVFNTWKQFPKEVKDKDRKVWRIDHIIGRTDQDRDCLECVGEDITKVAKADILVIENLGLGWLGSFMDKELSPFFNQCLLKKKFKPEHIILKMSSLNSGLPFPDSLNKTTVILSANTLRERGAAISEGLSWDRTIEDTVKEFESGLSQFDLALCQRVIVLFSAEGAALFEKGGKPAKFHLEKFLYHPSQYEGSFKANHPGQMSGNLSLVTAAVVRHLVLLEKIEKQGKQVINNKYPLFVALSLALAAIRKQYEDGFQEDDQAKDPNNRFKPEKHIDCLSPFLTLTDCLQSKFKFSDGKNNPYKIPGQDKAAKKKRRDAEEKILEHKAKLDEQFGDILKRVKEKTSLKLAGEAPTSTNWKIDLAKVQKAVDALDGLFSREV
ncbi:MAG: hypothetical protein HY892_14040, partial [Deltaproteobacteria bacterium]|nr:hypothetical protein [Deltaproteobacteria bacterium]